MTLAERLWTYQAERFPLKKTVPLLAVLSAASISVSAHLAGRPLPKWGAFAAAFAVAMAVFFQMRACDEWKDAEDDRRYRPHRPIPRGLIQQSTVLALGASTVPFAAIAAWLWHPPVLWMMVPMWIWLGAMTVEFGVSDWLKARPVLYLLSHMLILPLLVLVLTAFEWMPAGSAPQMLWMFLALAYVNGCVIEIGRKLWATENEVAGVDTYSGLWGPKRAATVWLACVALAWVLLTGVAFATGTGRATLVLGGAAFAVCAWSANLYRHRATAAAEARMDTSSGLWVFFCYATAGFLPFVSKGFG